MQLRVQRNRCAGVAPQGFVRKLLLPFGAGGIGSRLIPTYPPCTLMGFWSVVCGCGTAGNVGGAVNTASKLVTDKDWSIRLKWTPSPDPKISGARRSSSVACSKPGEDRSDTEIAKPRSHSRFNRSQTSSYWAAIARGPTARAAPGRLGRSSSAAVLPSKNRQVDPHGDVAA